jgi:HAD superfamily hydrolase (TIGR01509 family)
MKPIAGVILDVGGTVWPERWPNPQSSKDERAHRLRSVFPWLRQHVSQRLLASLEYEGERLQGQLTQDTQQMIQNACQPFMGDLAAETAAAVRRAMCLPASRYVQLFDGAIELLRLMNDIGLHVVVVTNSVWRDAEAYRKDFVDFGCDGFVHDIVTSVDAKLRKPHPGIFATAVRAAECRPDQCIVIGNSVVADIEPCRQMGMHTILVLIESTSTDGSERAHAVARSLYDVANLLGSCGWQPEEQAEDVSNTGTPRSPRQRTDLFDDCSG